MRKTKPSIKMSEIIEQLGQMQAPTNFKKNYQVYIECVQKIKKSQSYEQLCEILQELSRKFFPNSFVINQTITKLINFGFLDDAENLFALAKIRGVADEVTYGSMIPCAEKTQNAKLLRSLFQEICNFNSINHISYRHMITVAGNIRDVNLAEEIFEEACHKRKLKSKEIYCVLINAAGKNANLSLAKKAYEEAHAEGFVDEKTYGSMIDIAANNNNNLEFALSLYNNPPEKKFINEYIYTSLILGAGRCGQLSLAKQLFDCALKAKKFNTYVFLAMLDAAEKNRDFPLAHSAYLESEKKGVVSEKIFTSIINIAGKNANFSTALKIYHKACSVYQDKPKHLTPIHTAMLNAAAQNGRLRFAEAIFLKTLEEKNANEFTYSSMINAAGKKGNLALAKRVYKNALENNFVDIFLIISLINAAGENGDLSLANEKFQEICYAGKVDVVSYTAMIKVAGRNGNLLLARRIFSAHINLANAMTYATMIDIEGKSGSLAAAIEIYRKAIENKKYVPTTFNSMITVALMNGNKKLALKILDEAKENSMTDKITEKLLPQAFKSDEKKLEPNQPNDEIKAHSKEDDSAQAETLLNKDSEKNQAEKKEICDLIASACRKGDLESARRVFDQALEKGMSGSKILVNQIESEREIKNLESVKSTLEFAKNSEILDADIFNAAIYAAGNLEFAIELFNQANSVELVNATTFVNLIYIAGENRDFSNLMKFFNEAVNERKLCNINTFIYAFFALEKCGRSFYLKDLYAEAIRSGFISIEIFTTLINLAARSDQLAFAKEVFLQALKQGFANAALYKSIIKSAVLNKDLNYAREKLDEACRGEGLSSLSIFHVIIDAYVRANDIQQAEICFKQSGMRLNLSPGKEAHFNLSGFSYGSIFFLLPQFFGQALEYECAKFKFSQAEMPGAIEIINKLLESQRPSAWHLNMDPNKQGQVILVRVSRSLEKLPSALEAKPKPKVTPPYSIPEHFRNSTNCAAVNKSEHLQKAEANPAPSPAPSPAPAPAPDLPKTGLVVETSTDQNPKIKAPEKKNTWADVAARSAVESRAVELKSSAVPKPAATLGAQPQETGAGSLSGRLRWGDLENPNTVRPPMASSPSTVWKKNVAKKSGKESDLKGGGPAFPPLGKKG